MADSVLYPAEAELLSGRGGEFRWKLLIAF